MKNVTITLDDETWRQARIHAAEHGTSLSALVKDYLRTLADKPQVGTVRDAPSGWTGFPAQGYATPEEAQAADPALPKGAYGRFPDGAPFFTLGGRPRQPGAMRGKWNWTEEADSWPEGFLEGIENGFPGAVKWWLPDDDASASTPG